MIISPFSNDFDRSTFFSGEESLDAYLRFQVSQDLRRHLASCYLLHEEGEKIVFGYYTLSAFSILLEDLPIKDQKKLPHYPQVPATLLGRLAVDKKIQGNHWGRTLVADALKRAAMVAKKLASWAIFVDPLNNSARQFYTKFGFRSVSNDGGKMFLTIKEIQKNLKQAN